MDLKGVDTFRDTLSSYIMRLQCVSTVHDLVLGQDPLQGHMCRILCRDCLLVIKEDIPSVALSHLEMDFKFENNLVSVDPLTDTRHRNYIMLYKRVSAIDYLVLVLAPESSV